MRKLKKYKPTKFMAKTSHYDKDAADGDTETEEIQTNEV